MRLRAALPSSTAAAMPKRRRVKPPIAPPLPSTPPPPQPPTPKPPSPALTTPPPRRSLAPALAAGFAAGDWHPLPLALPDLSLPLTLPTGQTFRWRPTAPGRFTGVVGPHLLSLSHLPGGRVAFLLHGDSSSLPAARAALDGYLNAAVPLPELWRGFAAADARFAEVAARIGGGGARVLRQDPVECAFQFLCSSNNNIARIEKMVAVLASFGEYIGSVGGFEFHRFPTIDRLALVSESELREAGFGYRAKYIVGAAKELQAKPGGGEKWLASLRELELSEVIDALCMLPGVGPKVAACIALFSLDKHHAIPVDRHVWKVATQYLMPELAGMTLTPKLCNRVSEAFVAKFGTYAGWAQNVLFIGQLSSQNVLPAISTTSDAKPVKRRRGKNNAKTEVSTSHG